MTQQDHIALYRKYRPSKFEDVIGQEHIVSVLKGAVKEKTASHAYLFVGSRGTGKTSVARIFAKDLDVSVNDIYEIDAASNRGIDDIRSLRDGVRVLPFDSKYKIYIIDEVHMLSRDAWGVLLKTLEEPPSHVIFILATTEFHKVPETIVSRCQVFRFKKPTEHFAKILIEKIAEKEGYELEKGATELLAVLGDGSYRDTLGALEKVMNFSESKKISKEFVENITGTPKTTLVNSLMSAIGEKDLEKSLSVLSSAVEENLDMNLYLKLVIMKFRLAMVKRYAPGLKEKMKGDHSQDDLEFIDNLISKENKGVMFNPRVLTRLLEAYKDLEYSFIKELPIQIALVEILEEE